MKMQPVAEEEVPFPSNSKASLSSALRFKTSAANSTQITSFAYAQEWCLPCFYDQLI